MATVTLKGKIMAVGPVETVGEKGTKKQTIVLTIPPYRDAFGDIKGVEETWRLDIIGDNVTKFAFDETSALKNAECKCYINSSSFIKEDVMQVDANGLPKCIINAVLGSFEYHQGKETRA